jgi:glycosyltransferase involved in cell wall biosynthesis
MTGLSVVIITFNEAKNIRRAIESALRITDDVVVWDSFSTDATSSICAEYPVRFFQHQWEGYSISKNKANAQAKYDWILSLDADEALDEQLTKSIVDWKLSVPVPCSFKRLTNYCGHWIRHCGWYPDIKFRLFNRTTTKWEGLIHERLVDSTNSNVVLLNGDCLHYSYYTPEDHYKQALKFVTIMAQEKVDAAKRTSYFMRFFSAGFKFFQMYFLKGGILDGSAGYWVCRRSAWAAFMKYKLWFEFQNQGK